MRRRAGSRSTPRLRIRTGSSSYPTPTRLSARPSARAAWARLIAKVYEVDPMISPRCGSPMKVLAVITDSRELAKILRHLVKTGKSPPGLQPSSLI